MTSISFFLFDQFWPQNASLNCCVITIRHSLAPLRIQRAEDDGVDGVVSPEEQPAGGDGGCHSAGLHSARLRVSPVCQSKHLLPLVVSERDALRRHFEVDHGGRRGRGHGDGMCGGLLYCLVTRQRLQRHRTQVPHVTRCTVSTNTHTQSDSSEQCSERWEGQQASAYWSTTLYCWCWAQVVYLLLVSGVQLLSLSSSVQLSHVFPPKDLESKNKPKKK